MNIKESEIKLLERFKKNRIKIRLKKEDRILIIENLNYYSGLMRLGSKNLYATSNNLRPKYLPKNIKFKKFNNRKLDFKSNNFKFIFCNGILSHLSNHKKIISEIYRILDKDGMSWINVYGQSSFTKMRKKFKVNLNKSKELILKKILFYNNFYKNKINFILEILNTKKTIYFEKKKFENYLKKTGFKKIKFCKRGYKTDLSEKNYKDGRLKSFLRNSELRYLLTK